jgi:uncharacterized membrane protein YbhN (UPF0104 family)
MRRVALSLLGVLISAAAIFLVLRSVDVRGTLATMVHAWLVLLAAALPLIAIGIALRSWRWQRLLPADPRRVPVLRIVPVLLIVYLGNAVLPARLGEPIRAYLLARRESFSSARVFGTRSSSESSISPHSRSSPSRPLSTSMPRRDVDWGRAGSASTRPSSG